MLIWIKSEQFELKDMNIEQSSKSLSFDPNFSQFYQHFVVKFGENLDKMKMDNLLKEKN